MSEHSKRVRIERDSIPMMPDWDAHVPIVYVTYGGWVNIPIGAEFLPDEEVLKHIRGKYDDHIFERWLNIVGDCKTWGVDSGYDRSGYAMAVPSKAWREHVGFTDEEWAERVAEGVEHTTDYTHYCNGDVFYLTPQRRETWIRLDGDRAWEEGRQYAVAVSEEDLEHRWTDDPDEHDRAVGGMYGEDWALNAAKEIFPDTLIIGPDGEVLFDPNEKKAEAAA